MEVFDHSAFGQRQVDVIGLNATGLRLVADLAKLGVQNIHVYDEDAGKLEALKAFVEDQTGTEIVVHTEQVNGSTSGLGEVVFLMGNTGLRQEIWEGAIKFQPFISVMFDVPESALLGRIYAVNPNSLEDIELYEAATDNVNSELPPPIEPVAGLLAELALLQFVRWFAIQNGTEDKLETVAELTGPPLGISSGDGISRKLTLDLSGYDGQIGFIGTGATGSRAILVAAMLGAKNIHVWDDDKVESHNVPNQAFGNGDVGKLKVEAVRDLVRAKTGIEITIHPERVYGTTTGLGNVVFLLTDSMKSRKEIWEGAIKNHPDVSLMIETRMGAMLGRIYSIDPNDGKQIEFWESSLYTDEEAPRSACGATISLGPCAGAIADLALIQLVRWVASKSGSQDKPEAEVLFFGKPLGIITRTA